MSTTAAPPTTDRPAGAQPDADPSAPLRARLQHNAAFSGAGGVVAAVGCVPLADLMGFDQWWLLLAIGVGLVGFAALVAMAAAGPVERLRTDALVISLADGSWVLGSVAVSAVGVLSAAGVAIVLAQAAVVAFFGITQWRRRRELG